MIKTLPFYLLLVMTLGLAGAEKIYVASVPGWFIEQFQNTFLNLFPGGLWIAYFFIAALELFSAGFLLIGIFCREFSKPNKKFLTLGIFSAQITFLALGFGQRLTHQYSSAAELFVYAAMTFLAGQKALQAR